MATAIAVASVAALSGVSSAGAATATCSLYAGPFGSDLAPGNQAAPLRTAQRLVDLLAPGQTGCLLSGTYSDEVTGPYVVRFNHGGGPGAPITLRSVPGGRARLRGVVYVPSGSNHVTISDLDIDGRPVITRPPAVSVQIMAEDTILERNDVTNGSTAICTVLGAPGWGRAARTVVRGNRFHDCGRPGVYEHSIYIEAVDGALVTDNLILRSGAYAIHLYPDARATTVTHNVMVDNGGGVIFAGEGDAASSDDTVSQNVIVGSVRRPGIHSWWGGKVGSGNLASSNCMYNPSQTNVDIAGGGFTSRSNVIASPRFVNPGAGDYRLATDSPCLALVGYDTAAKLDTPPAEPTATPTPPPTPSATATAVATATPTPTPASIPTVAPTPAPTATAVPTEPPTVPIAPATPPTHPSPAPTIPAGQGTVPAVDPDAPAVEAARLEIDSGAFSARGGSPATFEKASCRAGNQRSGNGGRSQARCLKR